MPIPKRVKIILDNLKTDDLEYFCNENILREAVMNKLGIEINPFQLDHPKNKNSFFVVKTNSEYCIIIGDSFISWLNTRSKFTGWRQVETEIATACMKDYITKESESISGELLDAVKHGVFSRFTKGN